MKDWRLRYRRRHGNSWGASLYILLVPASYGPMNKVDGRLDRLLAHASSALQNGSKMRSEGPPRCKPRAKPGAVAGQSELLAL